MPEDQQHESREHAQAVMLGEDHGLGTFEKSLRARRSRLFGWCVIAAIPVGAAGLVLGPYVALGGAFLFALGVLIARRTWPPREDRVWWYSGGIARLAPGAPPRVVRWDDVVSVSARLHTSSESGTTSMVGCVVRDRAGAEVVVGGEFGLSASIGLARFAACFLSPRFVPPLIRRYESRQQVVFGNAAVSTSGISRTRAGRAAVFTFWREMHRIDARMDDPLPSLRISRGRWRSAETINLSGDPNDIFIFDLVRHAAKDNGVPFHSIRADEVAEYERAALRAVATRCSHEP
jgi:hypothetical protein